MFKTTARSMYICKYNPNYCGAINRQNENLNNQKPNEGYFIIKGDIFELIKPNLSLSNPTS